MPLPWRRPAAGLDESTTAMELGLSLLAQAELARQMLSKRDVGRGLPHPPYFRPLRARAERRPA